jgi:hypothetical protein
MILLSFRSRLLALLIDFLLILSTCRAKPTGDTSGSGPPSPSRPFNLPARPKKEPGTPPGNSAVVIAPGAPGKSQMKFDAAEHVKNWMDNPDAIKRLSRAPFTKGGMEGWWQLEIENYLLSETNAAKYNFRRASSLREVHVYDSNEKSRWAADIVIRRSAEPGTHGYRGLVLELKFESSSERLNGKYFAETAVKVDQDKIMHEMKDEFKTYDREVMAIAWSEKAQESIRNLGTETERRSGEELFKNVEEKKLGEKPLTGRPGLRSSIKATFGVGSKSSGKSSGKSDNEPSTQATGEPAVVVDRSMELIHSVELEHLDTIQPPFKAMLYRWKAKPKPREKHILSSVHPTGESSLRKVLFPPTSTN